MEKTINNDENLEVFVNGTELVDSYLEDFDLMMNKNVTLDELKPLEISQDESADVYFMSNFHSK